MTRLALLPLVFVLLLPSVAHAEETNTWGAPSPPPPALEPEPEPTPAAPLRRAATTQWYGWQTLLVDGLSFSVLFVRPELGVAGYALGAPIVHAAHDRWAMAGASVACRLGCPLTGAVLLSGNSPRLTNAFHGLVAGAGVAVLVDAAALSWKDVPVVTPRAEGGADIAIHGTW